MTVDRPNKVSFNPEVYRCAHTSNSKNRTLERHRYTLYVLLMTIQLPRRFPLLHGYAPHCRLVGDVLQIPEEARADKQRQDTY